MIIFVAIFSLKHFQDFANCNRYFLNCAASSRLTALIKQESRAIARKSRDAAAVLFGLKLGLIIILYPVRTIMLSCLFYADCILQCLSCVRLNAMMVAMMIGAYGFFSHIS